MEEHGPNLHDLDPETFCDYVHSFQFWFDAVQGYLEDRSYGHRSDTPTKELDEKSRDNLITVLCNYCVGETMALEGAGGLIRVAPNRATKIFLSTQAVDEGRHLEILERRLTELGVPRVGEEIERRASPKLFEFHRHLLAYVDAGDWNKAIFAQNVILESMEFASFYTHSVHTLETDPKTHELLVGIIKDERRHIGFGQNELARRIAADASLARELAQVRKDLDPLVFHAFDEVMEKTGAPRDRRTDTGRAYLQAVERLGIE